ncbi:MAG TPA: carboxypeptidase-like regulatory domain-containing protein, partial [Gemmatimonadaceae bacterium]
MKHRRETPPWRRCSAARFVTCVIALAVVLVAPRAATAQSSASGIISGVVRDNAGAPVATVQVTTSRSDGSYERRDVTGADGTFRLAALPPGAYNVTARRIGYQLTTVQHVAVSAANVSSIDVRLEPLARALTPMVVNDANRPSG